MRFNLDNDGSPGTMVSLLLSRAISKLFPTSEDVIRIALCVNQRTALHAPLAHQSLVGGVMLEYKDRMRDWPLDRQATSYRGMVLVQSQEEIVLSGLASASGICRMILSKESDRERQGMVCHISDLACRIATAAVNGRFTLDFIQRFSSPVYVNAFLKELEDNGIVYDLQDVKELKLPNIKLPWTE